MNKKALTILAVIAAIIAFWFFIENEDNKKKIKDLKKLIDENENLTEEIKLRLKELIENNQDIEPIIAAELGQIVSLIDIKQNETAVLKLAKIIEKLLKEIYTGNTKLKEIVKMNNRRKPAFADYLQCARENNVITTEDFHLLSVMKIIRNEEAHELDVKKEKSRVYAAFISGIGLVLSLCRLLKKKSLKDEISDLNFNNDESIS